MHLKTDYEIGALPHAEHPMPQARREHWQNLNGTWDFCKIKNDGTRTAKGKILVPFSPETVNSGIARGFSLPSGESLFYARDVFLDDTAITGRVLLHFGAVDSECEVLWNGTAVGAHRGGFTPFTLDITAQCHAGENRLAVLVRDEATRNGGARGKQADKHGGIWYTPQSGIWQTVWLEYVPTCYIKSLKITPDAATKTVRLSADSDGATVKATVFDGGAEILSCSFVGETLLSYDFELWSPEHPKLYDLLL